MRLSIATVFLLVSSCCLAQSEPRVQVTGVVTDARTGKPVYYCLVEHYDLAGKRWSLTTVNSEGRYAMFVPAGEPFELRIVDENGYEPLAQHCRAAPPNAVSYRKDLKLVPR